MSFDAGADALLWRSRFSVLISSPMRSRDSSRRAGREHACLVRHRPAFCWRWTSLADGR